MSYIYNYFVTANGVIPIAKLTLSNVNVALLNNYKQTFWHSLIYVYSHKFLKKHN